MTRKQRTLAIVFTVLMLGSVFAMPVSAQPDPLVNASNDGPVTAEAGGTVTVTAEITNNGSDADGATITLTGLPDGATIDGDNSTTVLADGLTTPGAPNSGETVSPEIIVELPGNVTDDFTVTTNVTLQGAASGERRSAEDTTTVSVESGGFSVESVDGPVSTFHGDEVDVTANITNSGAATNTQEVTLSDSDGSTLGSQSITLDSGESDVVTFENIDTTALSNADPDAVVTESLTVAAGASSQTIGFTVGTAAQGEVFVDVRNADAGFSEVEGATVTIEDSDGDQIGEAVTPASGTVSFDNLAVSPDAANPERYTVRASAPDENLNSESTTAELFIDGSEQQRTDTVQLNLRSNLDAQYIDVVAFDNETNTVVGQDSALFANGEFDNTGEFAVVTQNQENEALSGSIDVTVEFTGEEPDGTDLTASGAYDGAFAEGPGSFADDDDAVRTLNLTIDANSDSVDVEDISNANQIQNASGDAPVGSLSVVTFNATAELANETTLNDPVITESFTAEAINSSGDVLGTDSGIDASRNGNNVTYFLEGDTKISGQVQTLADGEVEYPNATVYIAYSGGPQDLSTIESFQNDDGVSFLTAEPNENGDYVIDGVVEEAIDEDSALDANLYVVSDGFNTFNMTTEPAPLSGTFAAEYVAPIDEQDVTRTGNTFKFTFAHVLERAPLAFDLDVTAENTPTGEQVKDARVQAGQDSTIEVSVQQGDLGTTPDSAAVNQEVDVELTDDNIPGELVGADDDGVVTTETNADGVAEVTFDAADTAAVERAATVSSNVTASVVNVDGEEFNTTVDDPRSFNNRANQSRLTVFATGSITGDVLNANDTKIDDPEFDVQVELFQFNRTSDSFDDRVRSDNITNGEFSFVDLPTSQDYQAVATVTNETGATETGRSRQIEDLRAVTENADIVVTGVADEAVDTNESESLARFDTNGEAGIQRGEVVDAIVAFNGDGTIGDEPVTRGDVVDLIVAFNAG